MKTCLVLAPERSKFSPLLFAGEMDQGIRCAAALGYDGVELNIRDSAKIDQENVIALLNTHNLKLVSIGTGQAYYEDGISLANADPKIREQAIARLKDHMLFAQKSGAQVVIGSIRGTFSPDPKIRNAEHHGAVTAIKTCADFARQLNVTLTIEPINNKDTSFINTMQEGREFLKKIDNPCLKLLADTYQMDFDEPSISNALKLAGNLLAHVHLVDSDRLVPGRGHIDFRVILDKLKEMNYQGYLSAEILPEPDDQTAAKQFIENVRKLLATI